MLLTVSRAIRLLIVKLKRRSEMAKLIGPQWCVVKMCYCGFSLGHGADGVVVCTAMQCPYKEVQYASNEE